MPGCDDAMKLIAFAHAPDDPACRFRIRQFIPYLERAGWEVSLRARRPPYPWITPWQNPVLRASSREVAFLRRRLARLRDIRAASGYDAVFLNRDLLEGKFTYEASLFRHNPRVVFDFDDAIFLGNKAEHIGQICRRAGWIIAGNEYLAGFARQHSKKVTVVPTVIDTSLYSPATDLYSGPVRVGWLGSDQSIRETLLAHVDLLGELQRELDFEFVVMTRPRPDLPSGRLRWRFIEWSPTEETRIANHFDIGIMPLIDTEYQRGKCGCKILQYMSASLPVIASPVGMNGELVDNGERGLTASSAEDWRTALASLIGSAELRRAMGQRGRGFVEHHYSVKTWFPRWLSIIEDVAASSLNRQSAAAS